MQNDNILIMFPIPVLLPVIELLKRKITYIHYGQYKLLPPIFISLKTLISYYLKGGKY